MAWKAMFSINAFISNVSSLKLRQFQAHMKTKDRYCVSSNYDNYGQLRGISHDKVQP